MNDAEKKVLIKLGIPAVLLNMSLEEFNEHWRQIKAEQELERRKNDPAFVQRFIQHDYSPEMIEFVEGDWVKYEVFIRFVTMLQKKADEAYQQGLSANGSDNYGNAYSWRV